MENREENKERESGKRTDGLVHIYCGDGKGKTTASVGAAVRAAGSGKKVVIKRFLKNDHSGEVEVLKQIPGITVLPCTRQFGFSWKMSSQEKEEAKEYYGEELEKAWKTAWGQEKLEVILTGRNPSKELLAAADYVTEMVMRAHPYTRGIPARKGIEY